MKVSKLVMDPQSPAGLDLAAITSTFFGSVGSALGIVIVAALALMATVVGVKALIRWGRRAVNG